MTALGDVLRGMIAQDGPITVERFMALALGHPRHGYYMNRDPFGQAGDFTTAPEISQMFGELLGLWAAEVWQSMGRPDPVRLVEFGPGRGTLMADAVRAARALPPFRAALDIHLVETSPALRQIQDITLQRAGVAARWHTTAATLPDGSIIVLANEFFDALPIRQFVRQPSGWHERLVGLDADGVLAFGLSPEPVKRMSRPAAGRLGGNLNPLHAEEAAEQPSRSTQGLTSMDAPLSASTQDDDDQGFRTASDDSHAAAVLEVAEIGCGLMEVLTRRLVVQGGALLAIDYGSSGGGPTLQAVKAHRFADPLAEPGEADLTAHVDFASLGRAAARAGGIVHGPVPQGAFLHRLGLSERAARLSRDAAPAQVAAFDAAVARLAGPDSGMGELFKVLAVTSPGLPQPPGFAETSS